MIPDKEIAEIRAEVKETIAFGTDEPSDKMVLRLLDDRSELLAERDRYRRALQKVRIAQNLAAAHAVARTALDQQEES